MRRIYVSSTIKVNPRGEDLGILGLELRCGDKPVVFFLRGNAMIVQEFPVNEMAFIFAGTVEQVVCVTRRFSIRE